MMQPGSPQALMPPDESTLMRRVQDLERQVRELVAHNVLAAAGVRTEPGRFIIDGDLEVPNGKIKNDWLESPVTFRAIGDTDAPVTATTTPTARAVRTMTVPGGYTEAAIVVLGSACIVNTSASTQYVYLRAYAIGTDAVSWWGGTQQITLAAGFAGTLMAPLIRTLPDQTPGDDMTFYVNLWASADLAVHANNWAGIEVQAQFTR